MNVLALDIGRSRVGIAVCVGKPPIASPLCVISYNEVKNTQPQFRRLIEDWQPDLLLCGLPYSLDGKPGPQAESVKKDAKHIASQVGLPLEFVDERLSSKQAKQILREQGITEAQMRGKIDMIAASIFLDTWLQQQKL